MSALLRIFVPGPVRNPLNGQHGHWSKHRTWAKRWREATEYHLFVANWNGGNPKVSLTAPKRITFTVVSPREWDDDNLAAAVKPVRDALVSMRVVHGDAPRHGHTFVYRQRRGRGEERGIEVVVEMMRRGVEG